MYQWWRFVHIVGAFGFLAVHGVSIAVALRLREERDPARINALLDISGRTVMPMYVTLGILLAGGITSAFLGDLWSFGWIWGAIATLVVVSLAMYFMARPYYQRVRFITRALAEGSQAVTPEQFDSVLRNRRPLTITWIGFAGLGFILYLMIMKPTLGLSPGQPEPVVVPTGTTVLRIDSTNSLFSVPTLTAGAQQPFAIRFRNADALPHNISIFSDPSARRSLFVGETFPGPATRVYKVKALPAGTYFFRCDVHPTTMTGSLEVA